MSYEEALEVVGTIFAGFPRFRAGPTTAAVWAQSVMRHDRDAASRVARAIVETEAALLPLSEVHKRIDAEEGRGSQVKPTLNPPKADCPDCNGMGYVDGGLEVHNEQRYSVVTPCRCRTGETSTARAPEAVPRRAELPEPVLDAIEEFETTQGAPLSHGAYRMICGYVTTLGPDRAAVAVRRAADQPATTGREGA